MFDYPQATVLGDVIELTPNEVVQYTAIKDVYIFVNSVDIEISQNNDDWFSFITNTTVSLKTNEVLILKNKSTNNTYRLEIIDMIPTNSVTSSRNDVGEIISFSPDGVKINYIFKNMYEKHIGDIFDPVNSNNSNVLDLSLFIESGSSTIDESIPRIEEYIDSGTFNSGEYIDTSKLGIFNSGEVFNIGHNNIIKDSVIGSYIIGDNTLINSSSGSFIGSGNIAIESTSYITGSNNFAINSEGAYIYGSHNITKSSSNILGKENIALGISNDINVLGNGNITNINGNYYISGNYNYAIGSAIDIISSEVILGDLTAETKIKINGNYQDYNLSSTLHILRSGENIYIDNVTYEVIISEISETYTIITVPYVVELSKGDIIYSNISQDNNIDTLDIVGSNNLIYTTINYKASIESTIIGNYNKFINSSGFIYGDNNDINYASNETFGLIPIDGPSALYVDDNFYIIGNENIANKPIAITGNSNNYISKNTTPNTYSYINGYKNTIINTINFNLNGNNNNINNSNYLGFVDIISPSEIGFYPAYEISINSNKEYTLTYIDQNLLEPITIIIKVIDASGKNIIIEYNEKLLSIPKGVIVSIYEENDNVAIYENSYINGNYNFIYGSYNILVNASYSTLHNTFNSIINGKYNFISNAKSNAYGSNNTFTASNSSIFGNNNNITSAVHISIDSSSLVYNGKTNEYTISQAILPEANVGDLIYFKFMSSQEEFITAKARVINVDSNILLDPSEIDVLYNDVNLSLYDIIYIPSQDYNTNAIVVGNNNKNNNNIDIVMLGYSLNSISKGQTLVGFYNDDTNDGYYLVGVGSGDTDRKTGFLINYDNVACTPYADVNTIRTNTKNLTTVEYVDNVDIDCVETDFDALAGDSTFTIPYSKGVIEVFIEGIKIRQTMYYIQKDIISNTATVTLNTALVSDSWVCIKNCYGYINTPIIVY